MTFSLYVLLNHDAPVISNEALAADFENYFRDEEDFSLEFERLPFSNSATLALRWENWLVRVCYEEGLAVRNDSDEIRKKLTSNLQDFSKIDRRIRVVFGDDDKQKFTNQIIFLIDYLKNINGALVFDPQRNNFII